MNEIWSKWIPLDGLLDRYYIISISDSTRGFKVILKNSSKSDKAVRIYFTYSTEAYRHTDESYVGGL